MTLSGLAELSGTEGGTRFEQRLQSKNITTKGNYGKLVMSNLKEECPMYIEDHVFDFVFD